MIQISSLYLGTQNCSLQQGLPHHQLQRNPKGTWFDRLKRSFVNTKPFHSLTDIWLEFQCKGKILMMSSLYCPVLESMEICCQGLKVRGERTTIKCFLKKKWRVPERSLLVYHFLHVQWLILWDPDYSLRTYPPMSVRSSWCKQTCQHENTLHVLFTWEPTVFTWCDVHLLFSFTVDYFSPSVL